MDPKEKEFELLLSEKNFVDSQIGGFFDLHLKLLTLLGASVIVLGWLYSNNPSSRAATVEGREAAAPTAPAGTSARAAPTMTDNATPRNTVPHRDHAAAVVFLALTIINCSIMLEGIVLYGSSLGYHEHKIRVLNREFAHLLELSAPPSTALWTWRNSLTRRPVTLSSQAIFVIHIVVNVTLLCAALVNWPSAGIYVAVAGAFGYLFVTIIAEIQIFQALKSLIDG